LLSAALLGSITGLCTLPVTLEASMCCLAGCQRAAAWPVRQGPIKARQPPWYCSSQAATIALLAALRSLQQLAPVLRPSRIYWIGLATPLLCVTDATMHPQAGPWAQRHGSCCRHQPAGALSDRRSEGTYHRVGGCHDPCCKRGANAESPSQWRQRLTTHAPIRQGWQVNSLCGERVDMQS
jgi:hypothetical protein